MIAKKLIPAAGYARRSKDMQETSIVDQRAYVEKWAAANGYAILRWFIDDGISGTSARGREAFERLLHDAEHARDFDTVLVYDISRFSRGGTNETGFYVHRLKLAGVDVVFCAEGIPTGDEGELLQGVKSWQARQYSVRLARDSIRGQLSHLTRDKSRLGSQAPFGYDRQYVAPDGKVLRLLREMPDGSRHELAPDGTLLRVLPRGEALPKAKSDIVRLVPGPAERVRTVKQMFEWCAAGIGIRTIAMRLNAAGIHTPMGRRWEHTSVASILRNPVYKGALVWNRTTKSKINAPSPDGSLRPPARNPNGERNGQDQWVVVENAHEPLVSAELWQRVQDEIDRRSKLGGLARPTNRYLLSGLVKCTRCGFNFNGHKGGTGGRLRYYMDGAYMRYGRNGCDPTYLNAEALDAFVLAQVRRVVGGDRPAVGKAVDRFVRAVQARPRPDDKRGRIELDLKAVQKRIDSVVALLADGELDDLAELRDTLVGLRKRRAALESELAAAGTGVATPVTAIDLRAWAFKQLAAIGSALATGQADEALRQTIQAYVVRIDIDPNAKRGVLLLPADAMAILERDALTLSRVKPAEAEQHAQRLRKQKFEVEFLTPGEGAQALRTFRDNPPSVFVIDLSRLPSHGRAVGVFLRQQKGTRDVPLIFVGGAEDAAERVKQELPDAAFAEWGRVVSALRGALSKPAAKPVVPKTMGAYSTTPLPKKLGVRDGMTVTLLDPPAGFGKQLEQLMAEMSPGPKDVQIVARESNAASVRRKPSSSTLSDLTLLFVRSRADLLQRLKPAEVALGDKGTIWIAWPKKASGVATDLSEPVVRETGLRSGLVDFKICAIDETWSALRFARRKPGAGT